MNSGARPWNVGLALALLLPPVPALGAALLPNGAATFVDSNGVPLASGTACFYTPATLTPKQTWQDANQVTPNTTPCVTLDAAGRATIYGQGTYRQILKDSGGNTVWDLNTADNQAGTPGVWSGGTSTGVNAQVLVVPVPAGPRLALLTGDTFIWMVGSSNTSATTLQINSLAVKNLLKPGASGPVALVANDLVAGNIVAATFDGTQFQLQNPPISFSNITSNLVMSGAAINEAQTTIAASATTNIGAALGNSLLITGNTTITAFDTAQAGTLRRLLFQSNPKLSQNATSLILPNATDILALAGDVALVESQGSGNWKVLNYQRAVGPAPSAPPRGYIGGLTLSNDGGTPNSVLDISAGQAASTTGNMMINLTAAFTKSTAGSWAAGSGANGMGNGLTIANSTWYHVCLAMVNGAADVFFDTSSACVNGPTTGTGTFVSRRVGSFKTDGAAHIIAFTQFGEWFRWNVPVLDVNDAATTQAYKTVVASVPTGIRTIVYGNAQSGNTGAGTADVLNIRCTGFGDASPSATEAIATPLGIVGLGSSTSSANNGKWFCITNTSAQIDYATATANRTIGITTEGWQDYRGRYD